MKKGILSIKLVEIPIISGSQGNKKPNICHLSNRGKIVSDLRTYDCDPFARVTEEVEGCD